MKNYYLLILFFIFIILPINAQFGPKQIIANEGGVGINTFDLDGDGDQDILKAGSENLAWFENLDGQGNFGSRQDIHESIFWKSASAADIDGDGDLDVVASFRQAAKLQDITKISWFENTDGLGDFGPLQFIYVDWDSYNIASVFIVDIDGDGDNDVLSGSDGNLFWFENLDGFGNFSDFQIIATSGSWVYDVQAYDFDIDGDMDVIGSTANSPNDFLTWYENIDGLGDFEVQQIIATNIGGAVSIDVNDINGDEYKDVLTITSGSNEVLWFENIDGMGTFGSQQLISTTENIGKKILARDIDSDGDMDVLTATREIIAYGIGTISWYENQDGLGNFGMEQVIHQEENFGHTLFASDLDGDNDIDIFGTSYFSEVAWFENMQELSIEDKDDLIINIHPNPTQEIIQIESVTDIKSIKIYDVLGKLVLKENNFDNQLSISDLDNGLFFVKIETDEGVMVKKIIKKSY